MPRLLRGAGAALLFPLLQPAAAQDDVIEVGQQLVVHFEFDEVPDTGNPSRPINGLRLSLGGMSRNNQNVFIVSLYDGYDLLAPESDQGGGGLWIQAGDPHPNAHEDLYEVASIVDGSIAGRMVFVNHGPGTVTIPSDQTSVLAAHFIDYGAFFTGGIATITRREIVAAPTPTAFEILEVAGGQTTLRWDALAGTVYAFQRRTKDDPRWRTFSVREGLAAGAQTETVAQQAGGVEFYRMEIVP